MREITTSTVIIKVDDSATLLAALSCVECSSGRGFVFFIRNSARRKNDGRETRPHLTLQYLQVQFAGCCFSLLDDEFADRMLSLS